ncbi:hypothetical protein BU14_1042s0001 [Porphyra umbilicalis]|uniref:Endonuclease/exonuclease/phosphatase domain-containing protein n=1 Tax=Porphyra umbilicalis TaxID=2786 RepID=A0A1X6NMM5_PORUM|nr:hypothetical protein BU14_1042s0001 [Porphyra umbilicalis]|eukprot:OSX69881.1 hypothetical protein BU14_1042s0001 [Porphyra umbilicalis]
MPPLAGYTPHWASSGPPAARGYAGVAMYVRDGLRVDGDVRVSAGIGWPPGDAEGRSLTAHLPGGRPAVVTAYVPNAGVGLKRLAFRRAWDAAFCDHVAAVRTAAGGAGVVVVGDLNVAPDVRLDVWGGPAKGRVAGLTEEERAGFAALLTLGGGGGRGGGGRRRQRGAATHRRVPRAAADRDGVYALELPRRVPPGGGGEGAQRGGWRLDYGLIDAGVWGRGGGTPTGCTRCRGRTTCRSL